MRENNPDMSEYELDELERITAELRCLERRCRKFNFSEVGYMLGLAEESAKQTLRDQAAKESAAYTLDMEEDNVCNRIIPFRIGA